MSALDEIAEAILAEERARSSWREAAVDTLIEAAPSQALRHVRAAEDLQ